MAGTKVKPRAKTQGKDIRGFFGGGKIASSSMSSAQRSNTTSDPIEHSDEEEQRRPRERPSTPHKSTPEAAAKPKSERIMDGDDEPSPAPNRKRKKAVVVSSSDEEEGRRSSPLKKPVVATASSSKATGSTPAVRAKESTPQRTSTAAKKRRRDVEFIASSSDEGVDDYEDDEDDVPQKGKAKAKAAPKKAALAKTAMSAKPRAEKLVKTNGKPLAGDEPMDVDEQKPKPTFNWAAARAAKAAGPVAPGSKPIPTPAAPDCLAGLSFVFTGELTSLSRDEVIELAKRNGGRVTLQPSSRTSYVVVGSDAGPSKLAAIKKKNLKTLDEDSFLNLIATRVPDSDGLDDKTKKRLQKERKVIREAAAEMEKREKKAVKAAKAGADPAGTAKAAAETKLWTDRYAPQTLKEVCGNKGQVEKLQRWLHDWSSSLKSGFKKPGKDGINVFRAVLITGPPGIGKTTSAHLCAKLEGFTPIELNASDARSKKLVENSTNITNASLDGWMGGGEMTNAAGVTITDKTCLIMDEVDGMSAGDRGGVGALAALVRKTKVPIICIANDRGAPKLRPLANVAFNLTFRKPEVATIRSRILSIAFKEKMKIPANVIDQLIEGAQSDIRQVLNMLSTWRLQNDTMDFDEGKALVKMNEKYAIMTPFNIIQKMLGPYMFSSTSRDTLNDKMELYFHDHSLVPLFVQENYLKTQPARVKSLDGPEKVLKQLELMDKAATSISDGDLVDSLIHGPEQHWSLMPLHAVCSTVRPASFLYGMGLAYGGSNAMTFPQWLGQNSKQNKLTRQLTEVQARMRLHISGDKAEIRQSYIPAMFPYIVKPLMDEGARAVDEVIERMDDYFVSREDWDTIVELGLDQNKDELVLKKISTATKTSFTRKYNSNVHPIPFHKATDLGKVPKKLATAGPLPDLEEAMDVDDEAEDVTEADEASEDENVSKDKLLKAPKASKTGKSTTVTKGRGKPKK